MNSLTVPFELLLGNDDMDHTPILPGDMNESPAVFGMDCLPIDVLRKRQSHRLEQVLRKTKNTTPHVGPQNN